MLLSDTLIQYYSLSLFPQKALQLYNYLQYIHSPFDNFTYSFLFKACTRLHLQFYRGSSNNSILTYNSSKEAINLQKDKFLNDDQISRKSSALLQRKLLCEVKTWSDFCDDCEAIPKQPKRGETSEQALKKGATSISIVWEFTAAASFLKASAIFLKGRRRRWIAGQCGHWGGWWEGRWRWVAGEKREVGTKMKGSHELQNNYCFLLKNQRVPELVLISALDQMSGTGTWMPHQAVRGIHETLSVNVALS